MPVRAPYFDSAGIASKDRYVMWLDVMGTRSIMTRSVQTAANFVYKLHVAALESPHAAINLYPMNDGVFAVADDWRSLQTWAKEVFNRIHLANSSLTGKTKWRKIFMVRGALAYGEVAEGRALPITASTVLAAHKPYCEAVLVGPPVVNSFLSERCASPFGIAVHESARTFGPPAAKWTGGAFMRYWSSTKAAWINDCKKLIDDYLKHCEKHSFELEYEEERIKEHMKLAAQYFDW